MEDTQMQTPPPAPAPTEPKKSNYGAIMAIVIVLALLAAGAYYALSMRTGMNEQAENQVESLQMQSTSTDAAAIESDLNAQSSEDFEKDMDSAYAEFDSAFDAK